MEQDISGLLQDWRNGDRAAFDQLVDIVHHELHGLARAQMAREHQGHSLQTTALLNETFLKLADCARVRWNDREHFFSLAAALMRRILVDHARERNVRKRGSGVRPCRLTENLDVAPDRAPDLAVLDDCLIALARLDPRKSKVVELKFFGGLSTEEIAVVLEVSAPTVLRDWKLAKSWLAREMRRCSHCDD